MDKLHRPEEYPFISDVVDIKEFFEEGLSWKEALVATGNGATAKEEFMMRVGCPADVADELAELCNPELLKCGLEDEDDPLSDKIPLEGKRNLVTLEIQERELQKRREQLSYRQMTCQLHKYKRTNFVVLDSFRDANEDSRAGYIPPDVILTVTLAKPYNRVLEYHEIRLGRLLTMDSAFYVRGDMPLTALRDKISCLSDVSVMQDHSDNPDAPIEALAKDVYKGGFFYINGVFYNDTRHDDATDLSKPITEWAQRRSDEMGPFTTAPMQDTKFIDLQLRLGQPYLYMHQGTCEHLIIFSDLRMMSSSDSQNMDDYPLLISLKPKKRVACCACKVYTAKWVTYEHPDLPFDPGFFCDNCYRRFNYDKDGKKIDDFKAVPYTDRSVLA